MIEFCEAVEEIDSVEAYYGEFLYKNGDLYIPFVNLGVSEHPLNPRKEMQFIDRAYMVFRQVFRVTDTGMGRRVYDVPFTAEWVYVGHFAGSDCINGGGAEFEIISKRACLWVFEDSQLSSTLWIPVYTANFRRNMARSLTKAFFENRHLPLAGSESTANQALNPT